MQEGTGSVRFGSGLFEKSSVRFGSANHLSGSTRFGLRFLNVSWLGPVRFGSVPRPVPAVSRIKWFGSVRPVRFGFFFLPEVWKTRAPLSLSATWDGHLYAIVHGHRISSTWDASWLVWWDAPEATHMYRTLKGDSETCTSMLVKSYQLNFVVTSGVSRKTYINFWCVLVQRQLNSHKMLWLSDGWTRRNVSRETPPCYDWANLLWLNQHARTSKTRCKQFRRPNNQKKPTTIKYTKHRNQTRHNYTHNTNKTRCGQVRRHAQPAEPAEAGPRGDRYYSHDHYMVIISILVLLL